MAFFDQIFSLSDEPQIAPSPAQGFAPPGAFIIFADAEALALARFSMNRNNPPILVVECDRGPGKGSHTYEGVKVQAMARVNGHVELTTNMGKFFIEPGRTTDPEGRCISRVKTLPEYFPMSAYKSFRFHLKRGKVAEHAA
jgi:hypothetical protein